MTDTYLIMPLSVVARGWEAFASVDDVLRDRGLRVDQLRWLYGGHATMAHMFCMTATFAVTRE